MCMGPPTLSMLRTHSKRVYPHVYESTSLRCSYLLSLLGLSPCVWGHQLSQCSARIHRGSTPMCMGPPFIISITKIALRVYPHVYGATSSLAAPKLKNAGLSPCVWGHPVKENEAKSIRGSIPMSRRPHVKHQIT